LLNRPAILHRIKTRDTSQLRALQSLVPDPK
jgi:hypothetical protein